RADARPQASGQGWFDGNETINEHRQEHRTTSRAHREGDRKTPRGQRGCDRPVENRGSHSYATGRGEAEPNHKTSDGGCDQKKTGLDRPWTGQPQRDQKEREECDSGSHLSRRCLVLPHPEQEPTLDALREEELYACKACPGEFTDLRRCRGDQRGAGQEKSGSKAERCRAYRQRKESGASER